MNDAQLMDMAAQKRERHPSLRDIVREFLAVNVPLSMQTKPFEDACVAEMLRLINSGEITLLGVKEKLGEHIIKTA